ncbi:MAG: secretin N-terminal domain-containing protein [Chthoniobacterales bacterium]
MKKLILSFLFSPLILSGSLSAQNEVSGDVPPENVEPMATPISSVKKTDPNADPSMEDKISVNFPDTTLTQILLNYERLSGKRLIKDALLAGQNMSIVVAEPVSKREAISIIEATLLLNNYALIPFGENQMKIVSIQNGKNPRSEGVAIYTTPNSLPEGDQVVSYFMTFKYRDALQAAQELGQAFVPHPYGIIFPVPNAQAVIVTESTSVIRRLLELKELIDVPPARIISEFVPLIRADAERVAETITKMIDAQKNNASTSGSAPLANNGAPPPPNANGQLVQANNVGGGDESASNSLTAGQIQLTADTRTNRILVISRPSSFPYVKSLIQEFDRSVGLTEPLEVSLRYVKPSDILQVLADLLTEDEKDAAAGGTNAIQQPKTPANNQSRSTNNNSRSSSNSNSGSLTREDSLEDPETDIGPESRIVGKTRIIADNKAGKVLVIGPPESLQKVRGILGRLDHKPQQVYLSAVIGQLSITGNQQFGIDYLQSFLGGKGSGIGGTAITSSPASTATFTSPAALNAISKLPALNGLSLYGTVADNLSIYVRALESSNRFKVLSRPAIYASNNEKAVISSGRRIAVPTQSLTNNNLNSNNTASVVSNIDYEDVVLKIEIVPQINSDQEVTMKIAQVNDSVNGSQTVAGQTVPTIATQEIRTTVTVANKNVVVLGGLVTESTSDDRSKIPVLGDIPYLGALFRNTSKSKTRDELLVFIQPNVVSNNDEAQRESLGEEARSEVGVEGRTMAEGVPTPTPARLQRYGK